MRFVKGTQPGWSALFSDDDLYRFILYRRIAEEDAGRDRRLVFIGLNPSTADAFKNDNTVKALTAFGRLWGCTLLVVVNAYAWRAKRPRDMFVAQRRGHDIIGGDEGDTAITCALNMMKNDIGGVPLAGWGRWCTVARARRVGELARRVGVDLQCLGTNDNGSPTHPLYQPRSTPLVPWTPDQLARGLDG